MADKIHCIKKTLRLTPHEATLLAERAKQEGMNEAEYLRLLLSQKPQDYPQIRTLLKSLNNEINRVGNNINQIVFHYHAGFYSESEKNRLVAYMQGLNKQLREVVRELGD